MSPSIDALTRLVKDPIKTVKNAARAPLRKLDRLGDRLEIAGTMAKETFGAIADHAPRIIEGAAHPRALPSTLRKVQAELTDELAADLQRVAASAYAEKDADKLRDVYALLALGGKVKGLPLASKLLVNHLTAGKNVTLPWSAIEKGGLKDARKADDAKLRAEVQKRLASGAKLPLTFTVKQQHAIDPAKSDRDLYYGIGHFLLYSKADVTVTRGADGQPQVEVTRTFSVKDPYDWNPNGTAGGTAGGVSGFDNDWGQYLVDTGRAKEFLVRATTTEQLQLKLPAAR